MEKISHLIPCKSGRGNSSDESLTEVYSCDVMPMITHPCLRHLFLSDSNTAKEIVHWKAVEMDLTNFQNHNILLNKNNES